MKKRKEEERGGLLVEISYLTKVPLFSYMFTGIDTKGENTHSTASGVFTSTCSGISIVGFGYTF